MKAIRNIFSYLLVLMFFIPATGFYYTRHSCLKSGQVQLVLEGKHSCCTETAHIAHNTVNQEDPCCDMESFGQADEGSAGSSEESSPVCCINKGNYLKSKDEYTPSGRLEIPHSEVITSSALYSNDLFQNVKEIIEEKAQPPPFTLCSPDILLNHSILLI